MKEVKARKKIQITQSKVYSSYEIEVLLVQAYTTTTVPVIVNR